MELTSKQRAQLRGLANDIDTIVQVGKDGIGDNLVKQVNDALEAREAHQGPRAGELHAHRTGGGGAAVRCRPLRGGAGHRQQVRALPDAAR